MAPKIPPKEQKPAGFAVVSYYNGSDFSEKIVQSSVDKEKINITVAKSGPRHRNCHGRLNINYEVTPARVTCSKCSFDAYYKHSGFGQHLYKKIVTVYDVSSAETPSKLVEKTENGKRFTATREMSLEEKFEYYFPEHKGEYLPVSKEEFDALKAG